ncbi:hypothetical protein BDV10DRAFT_169517, partial [Aspergillus recurvatus]
MTFPYQRESIPSEFPWEPRGQNTRRVLTEAIGWYRPLQFHEVDEKGAPGPSNFPSVQARLGCEAAAPTRQSVLIRAHMAAYRSFSDDGGQPVLLTRCDPHSVTFLDSWGRRWGDNGSFSIEDPSVLELVHPAGVAELRCYDVYWQKSDLT